MTPSTDRVSPDLERAVAALTSTSIFWWPRRRKAAEWLASIELTPDARREICRRLVRHVYRFTTATRRRQRSRMVVGGLTALFLSLLLLRDVLGLSPAERDWTLAFGVPVLIFVTAWVWMLPKWADDAAAWTCRSALRALGSLRDPNALLAVAPALRHRLTREFAATTLREITPSLSPQHYGRFGAESQQDLCAVLREADEELSSQHYGRFGEEPQEDLCAVLREADEELSSSILDVLQHIGGANCIPTLEYLAAYGYTERKRHRAADLLPLLMERAERDRKTATLLRPAETDAETLLRAEQTSDTSPDEILLRPEPAPDSCTAQSVDASRAHGL